MTRVAAPPTRIFNTVTGFICRRGERRIVTVSPASWRLSCARVRPLRDPLVGEARSYERLLPASLGGRKRTSKALCRRCNSTTGHEWDAELERQHRPIALFVFPPHHPCARKHRRVADAEGNHVILKAGRDPRWKSPGPARQIPRRVPGSYTTARDTIPVANQLHHLALVLGRVRRPLVRHLDTFSAQCSGVASRSRPPIPARPSVYRLSAIATQDIS